MRRCQENGLIYYRFDLFQPYPRLAHGVFTRHGGVSGPPCQGLNMGFVPEDRVESVRLNMGRAAETLGFDRLTFVGQVHGDRALVVRAAGDYRPRYPDEVMSGYDALITPDPEVGLLIKLADCQGVILFDPRSDTLAVVHAGWRGSVRNILGRTVARMAREFSVCPEDLLAGIGPSLGPCCAEFIHFETELPRAFQAYRTGNHFDFWAISRDQLIAAGLLERNIEIGGLCTKCGPEGFYSYRREGVTGRFGLIAGLRNGHGV